MCDVLDDEQHALYNCTAHRLIRARFQDLLTKKKCVMELLNPSSIEEATMIAEYLVAIEDNMKILCLWML